MALMALTAMAALLELETVERMAAGALLVGEERSSMRVMCRWIPASFLLTRLRVAMVAKGVPALRVRRAEVMAGAAGAARLHLGGLAITRGLFLFQIALCPATRQSAEPEVREERAVRDHTPDWRLRVAPAQQVPEPLFTIHSPELQLSRDALLLTTQALVATALQVVHCRAGSEVMDLEAVIAWVPAFALLDRALSQTALYLLTRCPAAKVATAARAQATAVMVGTAATALVEGFTAQTMFR